MLRKKMSSVLGIQRPHPVHKTDLNKKKKKINDLKGTNHEHCCQRKKHIKKGKMNSGSNIFAFKNVIDNH